MPTISRTNYALPRNTSGDGLAFKQHVGATKTALVGNGQGKVYCTGERNYGKVWIRVFEGVGDATESRTSPPKRAFAVGQFYPAENMVVKVRENTVTGMYEIEGNDVLGAAQRGFNTNGINPMNPSNNEIWLRQIRNGRSFVPTTNTASSTKVSIEPYFYVYNGVIKDATKGQSDGIDLASYIPTAGNERLVGVGTKASTNTVQISAGTTRTIVSSQWSLADIQEVYDGFDSDITLVQIYHLKDAQAGIDEKTDKRFDLRQFINIPNEATTGAIQVISSTGVTITQDAHFIAPVKLTGDLTIDGTVTIL